MAGRPHMARARISRRSLLGSVGAASLAPGLLTPMPSEARLAQHPAGEPGVQPAFAAELVLGVLAPEGEVPQQLRAVIHGGSVTGRLLRGTVQHGTVGWRSDPVAGLTEVTARFTVLREDGRLVEVQDRGVCPGNAEASTTLAICTAPV